MKKEKKYEYLCFNLGGYGPYGRQETLNEFSGMGWELIYIGKNWETCWRREREMENKKAQFAVPLGVLSRDGDILSPDALIGLIDGNKVVFTIEDCEEFIERLKKRGTWTITSTVKSSDC